MKDANVDALVLMGHDNIRYATDFGVFLICESYDWFAAIVTQGRRGLSLHSLCRPGSRQADARPALDQGVRTDALMGVQHHPGRDLGRHPFPQAAQPRGTASGGRRHAFPAVGWHEANDVGGHVPWTPTCPWPSARQVKHSEEIKLIRSSAEIASMGGDAGLQAMQEGALDFEVLSAIDGTMRAQGAEFITHNVCIKGESQLTAGWFPRGSRMEEGGTMAFDWGCYVKGWVRLRHVQDGFRGRAARACAEGMEGPDGIPPGPRKPRPSPASGYPTWTAPSTIFWQKPGYPTTPYSLGHGTGLRACELPIIYRPDMMMVDAQLEEGMVICLEPETSVEVNGETVVVKVEDMYQVTATGLDQLTTAGYTPYWED